MHVHFHFQVCYIECDLYFGLVTEKILLDYFFCLSPRRQGGHHILAVINPERKFVKDKIVFLQVEFQSLIKKEKQW